MGFISNLFGSPKVPTPSAAPVEEVKKQETKVKKQRTALLSTEGGIVGQELMAGGVGLGSGRNTLFGN